MIAWLLPLLCAWLCATEVAAPAPHPGPPVYVEVEVDATTVVFRFTGEQVVIGPWLGRAAESQLWTAPMPEAEVAVVRKEIEEFLARTATFTVDGALGAPSLVDIAVPTDDPVGYGVPVVTFALRFAVAAAPRRLDVRWSEWRGLQYFDATKLPLVVRSFGSAQLVFLTPEEPGFTWHPESIVPPSRPQVVPVIAEPPAQWRLPLVSIGVGLLFLLGLPFLVRARIGVPVVGALFVSATLTGWFARDLGVVRIDDPFAAAVAVPDDAGAIALFDQLQRNVYAAFDAKSESAIYDLLATSVAPELLDQTYGEVYESLILRGQGGAVCQVETVEFLEQEPDVHAVYEPWDVVPEGRDGAPFFKIRAKWRVKGVVSHWGHEHRRTNVYEAQYVVRHDPEGWRLAACEILDQSRVDDNG